MSFKISHRANQIEDSFLKLFAVGVFIWLINFPFVLLFFFIIHLQLRLTLVFTS